jgi:hypothetical protein
MFHHPPANILDRIKIEQILSVCNGGRVLTVRKGSTILQPTFLDRIKIEQILSVCNGGRVPTVRKCSTILQPTFWIE